jgi:biotin carboxyl carrier protein
MNAKSVSSPILGTVFRVTVAVGDTVTATTEVVILESMKMEHPVEAGVDGTITEILVSPNDTVTAGQSLVVITPGVVVAKEEQTQDTVGNDGEILPSTTDAAI